MSMSHLPVHLRPVTLLIPNMHCPSCVENIAQLLSNIPQIQNLNVSLLLHTVTFTIDTALQGGSAGLKPDSTYANQAVRLLQREGGFLVETNISAGSSLHKPEKSRGWLSWLSGKRSKKAREAQREEERRRIHLEHCEACQRGEAHDEPAPRASKDSGGATATTVISIGGMSCASCTQSITKSLSSHPQVLSVNINLLSSSGTVRHRRSLTAEELKELVEDTGFDADIVSTVEDAVDVPGPASELLKTTFSIEGMTCSSCSSAIHGALRQDTAVEDIRIDVLGSSGVVTHYSTLSASHIKEMIEDVGYDADIVSSIPVGPSHVISGPGLRTITLQIEGIYCGDCIRKLNAHLSALHLESFTPLSAKAHWTTITYRPREPHTIRSLIQSLTDVSPEFEASVVKERTMADRSKEIQRKELKILISHWMVALILTIPTFVIAIGGMVLAPSDSMFKHKWMEPVWGAANLGTIVLWPIATIVQFGVGRLFYQRAFASLRPHLRRFTSSRPDSTRLSWRSFFSFGSMDLLVVLSTTTSYFASLAMMILDIKAEPGTDSIGTYFDSSVFIIMFILLGRVLEAYAKSRTTDAVSLLGGLRPDMAILVESPSTKTEQTQSQDSSTTAGGAEVSRQVPVEHLERGDLILIPPGSLPPTDGIIERGSTTFDESSLTGESKPVTKAPSDEVFTGTTNLSSAITVRVTGLSGETMLEKIMAAVSDASGRKAPLEKLAERLTGVFVPVVTYFALAVLIVWIALATSGRLDAKSAHTGGSIFFAIEFAIAVLVVACPCGIGLAVPCANAVGTGLVAKEGILASGGGEAFVGVGKVDTVVFDKTGTLTEGKSRVTDRMEWRVPRDIGANQLEAMVREVEAGSTHPLAQGLVLYLKDSRPAAEQAFSIHSSEELRGRGLKATVTCGDVNSDLLIGNLALLGDNDVDISPEQNEIIEKWSSDAKSVILVAVRSATGQFGLRLAYALSDPPRATTLQALDTLRKKGLRVMMLSGDNESTARAVGKMVGIASEDVVAGVGPEGKAEVIQRLQLEMISPRARFRGITSLIGIKSTPGPRKVMFVGDGLNDSVALAAADISVAMGHGSQATLAGADFVLLSSNLLSLPTLMRLSNKITNRQKLNLTWANLFNLVCIPFAAGIFYPAGGIRLTPVWSALVMACSSLSVVMSSLALKWGL